MKQFFKYNLIGLKYLIFQGVAEIMVIVLLEYSGVKVLDDFSRSNLLIENIEEVAWAIGMKTLLISLFYLFLFVAVCYLVQSHKLGNSFAFGIINMVSNFTLLLTLLLLKHFEVTQLIWTLLASILASVMVLPINKIGASSKAN